MLQKPTTGELLKVTGAESRFRIALATAKRAREIASGSQVLIKTEEKSPVTIAANEIYEGKIKILGINSPKGIYKSPTQVNFNSFRTLKSSKSRKYILSNLHTNNNKIKNKNEKIEVKLFPKTPIINKKIIFDGFEGKRKISKNILNKFKKYKTSNTSYTSRKIDFHKYLINKKDFFYNNEFEI